MVTIIRMIALVLSIVAFGTEGRAQQIPEELVLERFSVAKGGDALLVPVLINGRKHNFLLDTGASRTVCDNSLQIGKPRGEAEAVTPTGKVMVKLFDLSDATVGRLPFSSPDPVAALNLKPFQEVFDHRIDGMLGLDFLQGHI